MYAIKVKREYTMLSFKIVYYSLFSLLYVISILRLTLQAKDTIIIVKGF
jgi:hypothetical protein